MNKLLPPPFATWHSFFIHLALMAFVGGVVGGVALSYKYGFFYTDTGRYPAEAVNFIQIVTLVTEDYVVGALSAERGSTGNIHFGTGPTYAGILGAVIWLLSGLPPLYRQRAKGELASEDTEQGDTSPSAPNPHADRNFNSPTLPTDPPQVATSRISQTNDAAPKDIYLSEINLYEQGDLDQSLWAKYLVEAEGDAEKAKWQYIKARVKTAPVRGAEQREAERKAAAEAERKATEEREAILDPIRQARVKKYEEHAHAGLAVKPKGAGCFWVLLALLATGLLLNIIS